jgi:hypothetical protein
MVCFKTKNTNFGKIWKALEWKNVVIFYEYFTATWYNLWPFGIPCLWSFGIFFTFWNVWTKKNLATLFETCFSKESTH